FRSDRHRIIVALHGGSIVDNLNSLRLRLFTEKAINNRKTVEIHTLPPTCTSASAKFHCLRARESKQDPCCWGWKLDNGLFVPVRTDMPHAARTIRTHGNHQMQVQNEL
ncbi:hypothetical protein DPMN_085752, partial [Dreissena polymorpha]